MAKQAEEEEKIATWSYPHFIRYLRAIIYRLTPEPHHTVKRVFQCADEVLRLNNPCLVVEVVNGKQRELITDARKLITTLPRKQGPGTSAREAANRICMIIECWYSSMTGRPAPSPSSVQAPPGNRERWFQTARNHVRAVERSAVASALPYSAQDPHGILINRKPLLTHEQLMECAVEAFRDEPFSDLDRDAMLAAMQAQHWEIAAAIAKRAGSR